MRVFNGFLELALLALFVLLIGGLMHGQTQGLAPQLIDSMIGGQGSCNGGAAIPSCVDYPEAVAIGDLIVIGASTDAAGTAYAASDGLGNTYTCTTPTVTPAPQATQQAYLCYTFSAFAGTDNNIHVSLPVSGAIVVGRYSGLSAVDGSVATATLDIGGTGVGTITTSPTTTVNNDLMISVQVKALYSGAQVFPHDDQYDAGFMAIDVQTLLTEKVAGLKGAQTVVGKPYSGQNFGSHATFAMQTLSFKPKLSIAIVDTAFNDCASGISCVQQLHCVGGTAAQTYSLFSGSFPAGISLNTATGAITGSSTSLGTVSLQFKCSDGTLTSAAQTLPLTVAGGFNTLTVRSVTQLDGGFGVSRSISGVACGDLILLLATGDDTHHGNGWLRAVNGVANNWHDSFGSTVKRILPHAGATAYPIVGVAFGPVTTAGTDIITSVNSISGTVGESVVIMDIAGAQGVVDFGTYATDSFTGATGSVAQSLTTLVPNEMVIAAGANSDISSTGLSIAAPFSVVNNTNALLVANTTALTASTVTATTSLTGGSANDNGLTALLFGLRPSIPLSVCNTFNGAGEKIRRQANAF